MTYFEEVDAEAAAATVKELKAPKKYLNELVAYVMLESLDKNDADQDNVSKLILAFKKDGVITGEHYMEVRSSGGCPREPWCPFCILAFCFRQMINLGFARADVLRYVYTLLSVLVFSTGTDICAGQDGQFICGCSAREILRRQDGSTGCEQSTSQSSGAFSPHGRWCPLPAVFVGAPTTTQDPRQRLGHSCVPGEQDQLTGHVAR